MVDTGDLKSLGQECLYGFESRPKHQQQFSGVAAFFSQFSDEIDDMVEHQSCDHQLHAGAEEEAQKGTEG